MIIVIAVMLIALFALGIVLSERIDAWGVQERRSVAYPLLPLFLVLLRRWFFLLVFPS